VECRRVPYMLFRAIVPPWLEVLGFYVAVNGLSMLDEDDVA